MGHLKYKNYLGTVEYNAENEILFGRVVGINEEPITYEGRSTTEIKLNFEKAIDIYLNYCLEKHIDPAKSYDGVLNLKISPDSHAQLAALAEISGMQVDEYAKWVLEQKVTPEEYSKIDDGFKEILKSGWRTNLEDFEEFWKSVSTNLHNKWTVIKKRTEERALEKKRGDERD